MIDRRQLVLGVGAASLTSCLPKVGPGAPPVSGMHRLIVPFDGLQREAWLYVPETVQQGAPAPLVIGGHGRGGNASIVYRRYGWGRTCAQLGWYGLFPNVGEGYTRGDPRVDEEFLIHLLDDVLGRFPVDLERVYGVGFSAGGRFMYRLAARAGDRLAAIGVMGSPIGDTEVQPPVWSPRTWSSDPISILAIHGGRDTRVSIDGKEREGIRSVGFWDGLELWTDWMDARERPRPDLPAAVPPRAWGREWIAPGGHRVLAVVDPVLTHRWPDYANAAMVQFFAEVPTNEVKKTGARTG